MSDNHQSNLNKDELISVCIATYKREALLEKLLLSLTNQVLPPEIKLEIIVTDNNSEASAEAILKKFSDNARIVFKYFIQPKKNISLTRNLCVENASGNFICFIDDDETASELWIKNLYDAIIKYNADGVFGYVGPIFDKDILPHFRKREFYFSPVGETGAKALFYFTTNAMVKAELIKSEKVPFNPSYGLTGGEDVHLFERLEMGGAKFIVCREAISFEYIPVERGTKEYLFYRALRGGQAFARRKLENRNNISNRTIIFFKAIIIIVISFTLYIALFFSAHFKINNLQNIGASIGKIRGLLGLFKNLH